MQELKQQQNVTEIIPLIDIKQQTDITYLLSQGGISVAIILSLTIFISVTLLRVSQLSKIILLSHHRSGRKKNNN
ncbi:hypothetical protein RIVM261_076050 [Rivularia sp. IAM M-261]|nr:hypothetical protein RIVM261_076050 [Rivularia sp. IAM M-261]